MAASRLHAQTFNSLADYPNTHAFTPSVNPTAGSVLSVALITTNETNPALMSISDNRGNTWSRATNRAGAVGSNMVMEVWDTHNVSTGPITITVNAVTDNYIGRHYAYQEIAGLVSSSARDKVETGISDGTTHSTAATLDTAQADEIVLSYTGTDNYNATYTVGSGYTGLFHSASADTGVYRSIAGQYKIVSVIGPQTGTMTTAAGCKGVNAVVTYKIAATDAPPDPPTDLSVASSSGQNIVSWKATNYTSFEVWRALSPGGALTKISGAGVPTTPSYTDTGLTNGTTYYYKIKAVNAYGTSAYSAEIAGTPNVGGGGGLYEWHPFGIKPNVDTATMKQTFRTKADNWFTFGLTTDGTAANSRLPGTVKRFQVPTETFGGENTTHSTVSEGQAYAMLFKAWLSHPALAAGVYDSTAKADFDALYRYYDYHKNVRGLMNWHILATNVAASNGTGGATDGDFDACEALRAMSMIHGDSGTINYGYECDQLLKAIEQYEFVPETGYSYPNYMTCGDQWGYVDTTYMVDYGRVGQWYVWEKWLRNRGETARADRWLRIIDTNLDHAQHYITNWPAGVPDRQTRTYQTHADGPQRDAINYNSVRLGFGWMLAHLWFGAVADPRAKQYMDIISNKFKSVFTTGGNVKAPPYNATLTAPYEGYSNMAGWAYVGSCSMGLTENQTFLTEIYNSMAASTEFSSSYFGGGVGLYGLGLMSGMTQPYDAASTPALTAPTWEQAGRPASGQLQLNWTVVSDATGYQLWRAPTEFGTYVQIATPTSDTYLDTGLTDGTTYWYKVKATNATTTSDFSTTYGAYPIGVPTVTTYGAPTAVITQASTTAGAGNVYNTYRSATLDGTYTHLAQHQGTQYTDSTVVVGTTYYYKMSASIGALSSPGIAGATEPAPATPTGVTATAGDANVLIGYNAVTGATSYEIARATASGGTFYAAGTSTTTSFTDTEVANGTTYYYKVKAVKNPFNRSEYSAEVFATPVAGGTPPPSTAGYIEIWNGTAWVKRPVQYWDGTAWVTKPLYYYNGTTWVQTD